MGVNYNLLKLGIDLNYAATVYGPIRLPLLENDFRPEYSSPFGLHNLKITKNFQKGLKVFVGARNIFNFTPPDYSILRAHDPFDKLVNDPIDNPSGYSFDASYMYASFQGLNFILVEALSFNCNSILQKQNSIFLLFSLMFDHLNFQIYFFDKCYFFDSIFQDSLRCYQNF